MDAEQEVTKEVSERATELRDDTTLTDASLRKLAYMVTKNVENEGISGRMKRNKYLKLSKTVL